MQTWNMFLPSCTFFKNEANLSPVEGMLKWLPQQQPVPYQPQVQIIPASGYPVLSQSFHAAQLEQVRAVPGSGMVVLPSSYTSSLLGNNQMMGQSFNNHSLGYSLSNAQLSYSLGSSSRDPHMERDDGYLFRDMSGGSRGEAFMAA